MKTTLHKLTACMVITALCVISCDLKEDTSAVSQPDNYFRSYAECQSVVNSCYNPLKSLYTGTLFLALECVSDLMYCRSGTLDAQLDISPATPRYGSTAWTYGYLGVQRCNFAIHGIENSTAELTDIERASLLCEAKALRGFYYWFLTCMFGDVPFYFDDVTDRSVQDKIAVLPRMSAEETRSRIIADLLPAAMDAPQTRTSDNDGNRAGSAMAYMVAAKMAMWNEDWQTALDALTAIEDIYGDFSRYDLEDNVLFRHKNTPESIFEIQHLYVQGGISYTSNLASMTTPLKSVVDGVAYFDGVEIPEIGAQATTWTAARPNTWFIADVQTRSGADRRATVNMAWEYGGVQFSSVGTRPWLGPKFWCPDLQASADGNNYKIFRYAGALLMAAECHCELGNYSEAVRYLNHTRERAGLPAYTFRTAARLRDEIRDECGRELFGEFQRKFDLVRWGVWYEKMQELSDYDRLVRQMRPCHRYYPIPDVEVVYSKYNLDNHEYEKYGY